MPSFSLHVLGVELLCVALHPDTAEDEPLPGCTDLGSTAVPIPGYVGFTAPYVGDPTDPDLWEE